jgi:hypothetical protein
MMRFFNDQNVNECIFLSSVDVNKLFQLFQEFSNIHAQHFCLTLIADLFSSNEVFVRQFVYPNI